MTSVDAPVQEGAVLAGKYRVEKVLGAGGMGVVVAAMHLYLNERVALKFLLPSILGKADVVGRFAREAQAAARIKSEHVARVSDVGTLENGAPYLVMELLEGEDLERVLETRGQLAIAEAVDFLVQACDAIGEAHSYGIVHRDLKPANLFLARRPDGVPIVKVLDFGISKAATSAQEAQNMTRTATTIGSPLYMSPEQIHSSKNVDARADVWSLGIILYQLLAGSPPFLAETVTGLVAVIVTQTPAPLARIRPDVPPALEAIIARCLDKNRDTRIQSVAEFAARLAPFGTRETRARVERIGRILRVPPEHIDAWARESPAMASAGLSPAAGASTTALPALPALASSSSFAHAAGAISQAGVSHAGVGSSTGVEFTRSAATTGSGARGKSPGLVAAIAIGTLVVAAAVAGIVIAVAKSGPPSDVAATTGRASPAAAASSGATSAPSAEASTSALAVPTGDAPVMPIASATALASAAPSASASAPTAARPTGGPARPTGKAPAPAAPKRDEWGSRF